MSGAQVGPLRFTVITSKQPDRLTKVLFLNADGTLGKMPRANMTEGHARHGTAADLRDLADQLDGLSGSQAVTWGLSSRDDVAVVSAELQASRPDAIRRVRKEFAFPGGPGVLMLDHDEAPRGSQGLDLDTLYGLLLCACPELADAPMLCRPSSSAGIVTEAGATLAPLIRWRIYIPVTRASDIPDAGERLKARLWATPGLGWIKVSKTGTALSRTIVDDSVWQPERLDFVAAPELRNGLVRPRVAPEFKGDPCALFDLARIELTDAQRLAGGHARQVAAEAAQAVLTETRAKYVAAQAPRTAADRGISEEQAARLLDRASATRELTGDYPLKLKDGSTVTVAEVLADSARYSGARMYDPLEQNLGDDPRVAIAYPDNARPIIYSHAHGGQTFTLHPDPAVLFAGAGNVPPAPTLAVTPTRYALLPEDPLNAGRAFVQRHHTHADGARLKAWQGGVYRWNGSHWAETHPTDIRAKLYDFLDREGGSHYRPTQDKVSKLLDALKSASEVHLDSTAAPPCWIDAPGAPPAAEIIACANGLLHLPTRTVRPATPRFFSMNAVPFNYEPNAAPPAQWLQFLRQVWPADDEAIATLQEVFGYLLTPDTSQQKIFLIIGPKRSGKGTIARVLTEMLGADNVAGPTLSSLAGPFGMQPLVGNLAAVISDARLSGRADQKEVAENLLRISGEDRIQIDRKATTSLTMRLGVRFVMLTNELPRIADASGAMASRFVILTMTESFIGREDPGLTARLLGELPGVLSWAVEGWHRLTRRGHFVEPKSSAGAAQELADLGSPIGAFVRDECHCRPGVEVEVDELFTMWRTWCARQGIAHSGTKQTFGRDLWAVFPGLKQVQLRVGGERRRVYRGIALRGTHWHASKHISAAATVVPAPPVP